MHWKKENDKLIKQFNFVDFKSALNFVNQIGKIAEEINHHPEITFTWGKVIVTTTTHDQGNKVTDKDLDLTEKIDKLKNK